MNRRDEREAERKREAEAALRRAGADETLGESAMRSAAGRVADHFSAADADAADPAEVWGKRIGRILALVAALALIVHLVRTYLPA